MSRVRSSALPGGAVPERGSALLVSSRSRPWNGFGVELYRAADVDVTKQSAEHVVTVFLRGPVDLVQQRYGRVFRRTMSAGDIVVTPAGEPKSVQHVEETELLKLRLAPSFVARVIDGVVAEGFRRIELLDHFGAPDEWIEELARRLLGEVRADAVASALYAETLATELVVHLLRHYSAPCRPANERPVRLPRYKLQRATEYISANLREALTLERISAALTMSPYHFARAFRQTAGVAPHRYVLLLRVERAKRLLLETDLPVTEIAHQVGYSSPSSFSVVFHRLTGRSPMNFRKSG